MSKRRTPALPKSVWSAVGPVPVVVVEGLKDEKGVDLFGCWDASAREIRIRAGIHPTTALTTAVHEWLHCVMYDAGIKLPAAMEERVCDCLATGIVADMMSHQ
jgi:hypothetical protein